mmetsp:Transcript_26453/g.82548  ORF Transcript_26453/g.82548 Transcript_26453/m.82548 type:complete len:250 (+) Transcript_26453:1856-2605(+)
MLRRIMSGTSASHAFAATLASVVPSICVATTRSHPRLKKSGSAARSCAGSTTFGAGYDGLGFGVILILCPSLVLFDLGLAAHVVVHLQQHLRHGGGARLAYVLLKRTGTAGVKEGFAGWGEEGRQEQDDAPTNTSTSTSTRTSMRKKLLPRSRRVTVAPSTMVKCPMPGSTRFLSVSAAVAEAPSTSTRASMSARCPLAPQRRSCRSYRAALGSAGAPGPLIARRRLSYDLLRLLRLAAVRAQPAPVPD